MQFSLTLIGTRKKKLNSKGISQILDVIFGTPIWNKLMVLTFQEIPFFITRLSILLIFEKTSKNYTLYLFCLKNISKISLDVFQIFKFVKNEKRIK